jgi:hypothetical protein
MPAAPSQALCVVQPMECGSSKAVRLLQRLHGVALGSRGGPCPAAFWPCYQNVPHVSPLILRWEVGSAFRSPPRRIFGRRCCSCVWARCYILWASAATYSLLVERRAPGNLSIGKKPPIASKLLSPWRRYFRETCPNDPSQPAIIEL